MLNQYCLVKSVNLSDEQWIPKDVVLGFWDAMRTNDFAKASEWLW